MGLQKEITPKDQSIRRDSTFLNRHAELRAIPE